MGKFDNLKIQLRDGEVILIRTISAGDAHSFIEHARKLFETSDQVLTTSDEFNISLEDETDWILRNEQDPDSLFLLASFEDQIIGNVTVERRNKQKCRHTADLGIGVHLDWRRKGVGSRLLQCVIDWAETKSGLKKINLSVFSTNLGAYDLYTRFGFIEEGRRCKQFRQPSGEFVDEVLMSYFIKRLGN